MIKRITVSSLDFVNDAFMLRGPLSQDNSLGGPLAG
jgi:hypothetical protein